MAYRQSVTERVGLNLSGNFAMLLLQPTSIGRKPWFFNVFLRFNTIYMQHSLLIAAIFATAALAACDKPTVVNVPVTPVTVPVPLAAGTGKNDTTMYSVLWPSCVQ